MKLLIASDLHGSYFYSRLLFELADELAPDRILLLGDLLYHGPRNDLPREYAPKKVIELLNGKKNELLCVRGNCDTEVDQMVLDFPILADWALVNCGKTDLFLTHGHKHNPKTPPPLKKGTVLLNGHTHVPAFERTEDLVYVNPGSVSIPKENSCHSLILLENDELSFMDLEKASVYRKERLPSL